MLVNFNEHIKHQFPFLKGNKVLVAISGGIDSVVLTHLLSQLSVDIVLAHCNFSLRGKESDDDEQFVKDLAVRLGVICHTITFDTKTYATEQGLSTQMAARELRYAWFEKLRVENDIAYIATAHHLDDNLETFIINFVRGTGLNGLTGIPAIKGKVLRPLLPFSKHDIEQYATHNKLKWREDLSNSKTAYQRNKIRHQIVPLLKEMNPNLLRSFQKTTNYLKESQGIIDDRLHEVSNRVISKEEKNLTKINIQQLKHYKHPKAYLFELLKAYGFSEWNDIVDLLDAQPGKQVFSASHRLVKDRDFLLLAEIDSAQAKEKHKEKTFQIQEGQDRIKLDNVQLLFTPLISSKGPIVNSRQQVMIDSDKLKFPLTLRKMKQGDYFYPLGMAGKKKISKFFKDEKLSLIDKENTWLLVSNKEIVWVVNIRLDERYKVDQKTKKILKIEFIKE